MRLVQSDSVLIPKLYFINALGAGLKANFTVSKSIIRNDKESVHISEFVETSYQVVISILIFPGEILVFNNHLSSKFKWEVDITKVFEYINIYKKLRCPAFNVEQVLWLMRCKNLLVASYNYLHC